VVIYHTAILNTLSTGIPILKNKTAYYEEIVLRALSKINENPKKISYYQVAYLFLTSLGLLDRSPG